MGIVQRQAFLNTIINYIGVIIGFLNIVILFPLFLSQEEFGLTRLVLSLATTMAQLSAFGVHRIAIKFFPIFRDKPNKNNGLLKIMLIISSLGFILVTGIYLLLKMTILDYYKDDSELFSDYFIWIPIATFGFLLFLVFESFLQALRKTVFTNFLRNVFIRFYWLIILVLYYYGYFSFFSFMIFFMIGYFLTAILCIIQLMLLNEFSIDTNSKYQKKRILKPLINYGFFTLLSGTTLVLVVNVDLIMIGAMMPSEKLTNIAVYAIATYIVTIIYIPSNSLSRISAPIIAYDWKKRNLKNISEFYKKSSVILVFFGGLIYGCIALNIDSLLSFLKPEYSEAKSIILLLGLARVFDMASGLNLVILTVTRFYRTEAVLAILLLVLVIITNIIFIPIYGIFGAALGTTIVFFTFNIVVFIYIWSKLKMQPFSMQTLYMTLLGILAALTVLIIPFEFSSPIIIILIKTSIFVILYFVPVYLLKISPDVNNLADKLLFNRLRKLKG